jgi:6-phosphofructokinase 1
MKRIAVVTSGGDAPGMNAAVRAIVRVGAKLGMEVHGVRRGYEGLIEDDIVPLSSRDVSGILHLGGTFLGTARSQKFEESESARQRSVDNLRQRGIECLIVIGGNGSQRGAHALMELGFPVIGVASTVDNDLYGSDISIGVDTALDVILESIDRIRTTAESHRRAFLIEVMGRDYGYLALMAGIAGGADVIVTPEFEQEPEEVEASLRQVYERGKKYALVVVTDGARNNAEKMKEYFQAHKDEIGYGLRITILGHVQRGGVPNNFDRILATRFGNAAVQMAYRGETGKLVGWINDHLAFTPLDEVVSNTKTLDMDLWRLSQVLAK